jgi:hypothetical protein
MKYLIFNILLVSVIFVGCRKQLAPKPVQGFGTNVTVLNEEFNDVEIVVVASNGLSFGVAFGRRMPDGITLIMEKSLNSLPAICQDQEGNDWDAFGVCIRGERLGQQLPLVNSTLGYYFSFIAMFPGAEVYNRASVDAPDPIQNDPDWLINTDFVAALSNFEGIHSVDDPQFTLYKSRDYIDDPFYVTPDQRITAVKIGNTIRAYPHNIFVRHEIVNDEIEGVPITVSFCPLTATSYCWKRESDTFGVSGMLFNNNLILYDRNTISLWSQILGKSVFGSRKNQVIERISVFETTFENLEQFYDFKIEVMTLETGFVFDYSFNPYGVYNSEDDFLLLPNFYEDDRLPNKERVIGVEIDGVAKVYPLSDFL